MNILQFGDYIFPHNPSVIEIGSALNTVNHFVPYIGNQIQIMGLNAKVVNIKGELFDTTAVGALSKYTKLESIFKEKNKGMLFIPFQKPFYAIFTKLNLLASGDGKVISYNAQFVEDMFKSSGGLQIE